MTRRAKAAVAGTLVIAGAVTSGVLIGAGGEHTKASAASGSTSTKSAVIERRDLVETDSSDGTLGFSDSRTVINRVGGTVTWLPPTGTVVHTNHRLYAVDGKPTYLLDGATPAYRALGPSTTDGADVRALERNLRALGHDSDHEMAVNGSWDSGTTAAVKRWQKAKGLSETGTIELGRVVFQPGARRVAKLSLTLGASAGASGSGNAAADSGALAGVASIASGLLHGLQITTPADVPADESTPAPATGPTGPVQPTGPTKTVTVTVTTPSPTPPARTTTTPTAPSSSTPSGARSFSGSGSGSGSGASSGATGAATSASSGASSSASSPIMTTTSTRQLISVDLDATKQSVAKAGHRVSVDLPDGSTAGGRIASVGSIATAVSADAQQSGDASSTITVTVKLFRRITALDQAPVTINFEQSRAKDVLAIPVTALLARPGGTFAVERRSGKQRTLVPVTTGLYAGGYVEIDGAGLEPGQRVTNAAI